MTTYFKKGNTITPTKDTNVTMLDVLPGNTYMIKEVPMVGTLVLEQIDNYKLNQRLYGKLSDWTTRILDTFTSRSASTGVMFTGTKGSGKSLLAKNICMKANDLNMPVIVVNAPWRGEAFNALIQSIDQPAVVVFDEFEKTYEFAQQLEILTLLDGTFPTKKLFVFTVNNKFSVDMHMKNRPGRIYYMIDFIGLEPEFIEEYCNDNLNNKAHIPSLVKAATYFASFNFDMLKAVVEELNRYNESVKDVFTLLNVRPEFDESNMAYNMFISAADGKQMELHNKVIRTNPYSTAFTATYRTRNVGFDNSAGDWEYLELTPDDIAQVNNDQIVYLKNGITITLIRKPAIMSKSDWYDDI